MPIIRSSWLWCWVPHWLFRSWFAVCWRLGAVRLEFPGCRPRPAAQKLQHTTNQERDDQYGNQHHSRELLMMGITVPETCWTYKKYNKKVRMILSQCCALLLCVWQACLASTTSHPRSSVALHLSRWLRTRKDIMYRIHCIILWCMFIDILLFYPILYAAAYQKVSPSKFPYTFLISPISVTWPVCRTPPGIHYRKC